MEYLAFFQGVKRVHAKNEDFKTCCLKSITVANFHISKREFEFIFIMLHECAKLFEGDQRYFP